MTIGTIRGVMHKSMPAPRVCLVSPTGRAAQPFPPFGLLSISAYLKKHGIDVEIVDLKADPYQDLSPMRQAKLQQAVVQRVKERRPSLVGFTCLVTEVSEVLELSARIKGALAGARVVVGGVHPTMYPEDLLFSESPVDFLVAGEGERTTLELVDALGGDKPLEDVAGLAWYNGSAIQKARLRPVIEDLDQLPFFDYDAVNTAFYFRPQLQGIRGMLLKTAYIFAGRGCPYRCTFCVNKNIQVAFGGAKPVRWRSVKNVVEEIELLARKYSIDGFYICDDTFTIKKDYVAEFCQELSSRKLGLLWGAETRVDLVNEDILRRMAGCGCVQLDFGVESGSPEILRRIKKGITVDQTRWAFEMCRHLGIRSLANILFNTPGETERDVEMTLDLARKIDATRYSFAITTPYPGTDLYQQVEPKLRVDEYHLLPQNLFFGLTDPRFKLCEHSMDLQGLVREANLSFNSLWKMAGFVFNWKYLAKLCRSRKKSEYAGAVLGIGRHFVPYYLSRLLFLIPRRLSPRRQSAASEAPGAGVLP